jgi:opacity protein-like surface antigen
MKNVMLLLLGVFMVIGAQLNAQTEQGRVLIGGTAGFESTSTPAGEEKVTTTELNLSPYIGYFVIDRLAIGADINFELFGAEGEDNDATRFAIGPFVRYYFFTNESIGVFGQAGINYETLTVGEGDGVSEFGFGAGVGADFFLNDNVAIEAIVRFQSSKIEDADDSTTRFGLGVGVATFIGGGE